VLLSAATTSAADATAVPDRVQCRADVSFGQGELAGGRGPGLVRTMSGAGTCQGRLGTYTVTLSYGATTQAPCTNNRTADILPNEHFDGPTGTHQQYRTFDLSDDGRTFAVKTAVYVSVPRTYREVVLGEGTYDGGDLCDWYATTGTVTWTDVLTPELSGLPT